MSMSNASYVSNAMGGMAGRLGARDTAKDILSRSIMDHSMAKPGNTSIMDIASGFNRAPQRDVANLSMALGKPLERSMISK